MKLFGFPKKVYTSYILSQRAHKTTRRGWLDWTEMFHEKGCSMVDLSSFTRLVSEHFVVLIAIGAAQTLYLFTHCLQNILYNKDIRHKKKSRSALWTFSVWTETRINYIIATLWTVKYALSLRRRWIIFLAKKKKLE